MASHGRWRWRATIAKVAGAMFAVFLFAVAVAPPANASTATCTLLVDCHAQAQFGGFQSTERFHGVYGEVHSYCQSITNASNDFVDNEIWLTGNFNTQLWIEAGQSYGKPVGARRYYFWADQGPNRRYAEHDDIDDDQPALGGDGVEQPVQIAQVSSTSYNVESGPFLGTTGGFPVNYGFNTVAAGAEMSPNGGTANYVGGTDVMEWYSQNNNWVYGWSYNGDNTVAMREPTNWGYVTAITANSEYHHGVATGQC